jgi:phage repressor protein C with HTH and peptisase S24 domain
MIRHEHIWRAVDQIAAKNGLSTSALARAAGLDSTVFNRSKRVIAQFGKARWLSTESVAKLLNATGDTMTQFGKLTDAAGRPDAAHSAAYYRAEAASVRADLATVQDPIERQILADIATLYDQLALACEPIGDTPQAEERGDTAPLPVR